MSTPATIITALKAQLEADTTLAAYVKAYLLGVREEINEFPCLIIEPTSMLEDDDIHNYQEQTLVVAIMGYVKVNNPDKQIVGEGDIRGILDVENDVKKAISADITIGGTVAKASITESKYDFADYPIRSFVLNVELYFRQNLTART